MQFFAVFHRFLRSYVKTDIKFEIYAKNYVYRLIFNLVRPNFSLVASPSSRRRPSASARVRPRIREAAVLGGRSPPQRFVFVSFCIA